MARIAIIVGHARKGSYCEALGQAYWRGARAGGHDALLFVTAAMTFDPVLCEGFERVQPLEPDLQSAHDAILAADHLVIVFHSGSARCRLSSKGLSNAYCSQISSSPQSKASS